MPLTLSYEITSLKVKDEVNSDGVTLQNAVCQTYWKCTGEDADGNTGEFSGATPFSAATVSEGNFTAFENLVEADVIGWVQAVVDGDAGYKAHIEEQIQRMIDASITQEAALPWATDVTPVTTPDPAEPAPADPAAPTDPEA